MPPMAKPDEKRRVYFNSACPVCNAGITSQRERMQACGTGDAVEWIDINDDPDALAARGVSLDDVRLKLYVEDAAGDLHVGADAFADLWRATPGQRWLGRLVSLPVLRTLARWAYNAFAVQLYRWNRRHGRW
jgi:predicted DCC family thiol-disulfide oxidoreductase YuxK